MEASGTSSVPQDSDGVTPSGDVVAGAAGTAAPAALTAEPLPTAAAAESQPPADERTGRPRGFGSRQTLILAVCCVAQPPVARPPSVPPVPQLLRAIGLWAAMNGLGGAAGTLFGGVITQELSWRWVLLINPPTGIATATVAYAVVADRRRARADRSF